MIKSESTCVIYVLVTYVSREGSHELVQKHCLAYCLHQVEILMKTETIFAHVVPLDIWACMLKEAFYTYVINTKIS